MRTTTKVVLGGFALLTVLAAVSRRVGDDATETEIEMEDDVESEVAA
jgi:hypothetical protein